MTLTSAQTRFHHWRSTPQGKALAGSLSATSAGVVYAFVALIVVFAAISYATGAPAYLSPNNAANVLDQASLTGLMAVSMTLVLISGNFDLSVGSTAALSGVAAMMLLDQFGLAVAFGGGLFVGAVVGSINAFLVEMVGVNAFIVTLGTLTSVRGFLYVITGAQSEQSVSHALDPFQSTFIPTPNLLLLIGGVVLAAGVFRWVVSRRMTVGAVAALVGGLCLILASLSGDWSLRLSLPVYFLLGWGAVAWWFLRYTVPGRRLFAVGGNREAARLSGIDVRRYRMLALLISGITAGFAGVLTAAKLGAVNPNALQGDELTVLAACILGGTSLWGGSGSAPKSIIGLLILVSLNNGFNILNLGAVYQQLIQGIVIIAAASVYTISARRQSQGGV
jgi:D-xylose transport system permease protein